MITTLTFPSKTHRIFDNKKTLHIVHNSVSTVKGEQGCDSSDTEGRSILTRDTDSSRAKQNEKEKEEMQERPPPLERQCAQNAVGANRPGPAELVLEKRGW